MSDKERDYQDGLVHFMSELAESNLDLSEKEIEDEVREEGDDPKETANRIRTVLLQAFKNHKQRSLRDAQERYEAHIAALTDEEALLPGSADDQRNLFMAVMTNRPDVGSALITAQHRDFKDLTDADIKSYLKKLMALGALDDWADEKQ